MNTMKRLLPTSVLHPFKGPNLSPAYNQFVRIVYCPDLLKSYVAKGQAHPEFRGKTPKCSAKPTDVNFSPPGLSWMLRYELWLVPIEPRRSPVAVPHA